MPPERDKRAERSKRSHSVSMHQGGLIRAIRSVGASKINSLDLEMVPCPQMQQAPLSASALPLFVGKQAGHTIVLQRGLNGRLVPRRWSVHPPCGQVVLERLTREEASEIVCNERLRVSRLPPCGMW